MLFPETFFSPHYAYDSVLLPRHCRNNTGLGYFPFARHYSGNRGFFLFLQILRCFSSLRLLIFAMDHIFNMMGCPIRRPADQVLFANPRRFSQLTASFVADESLGIRRVLLSNFSRLIICCETVVPYIYQRSKKTLLIIYKTICFFTSVSFSQSCQ